MYFLNSDRRHGKKAQKHCIKMNMTLSRSLPAAMLNTVLCKTGISLHGLLLGAKRDAEVRFNPWILTSTIRASQYFDP